MTKDQVIHKIRELADQRGGHISFNSFLEATGVKGGWLRGQEWFASWNSLLVEVGLQTRQFAVQRTPVDAIAKAVALLIEREGVWPTQDQLIRERRKDGSFPSLGVIKPLRRSGELARRIVELGERDKVFSRASAIAKDRLPEIDVNEETFSNEKIKGYVYLLRSGRRYKIGKSTDPSRRYREVRLELPEETHQVHTIPTDDPAGIEDYWHRRFTSKRIRNTEFFELNSADVQAFKRRKYQ